MSNEKILLLNYVDTATNLAEAIKKDIQKKGVISNQTVLSLNEFIIAANQFHDVISGLERERRILN